MQQVIKYLGSKRRLVPVLGELFTLAGAETALDLFTGTTRVAQEFKRRGSVVTAVDTARYSEVLAQCHIATDADDVNREELRKALEYLQQLRGEAGYFTETFCVKSRYFQPFNGEKVDAIRNALDRDFATSPLRPILLAGLLDAADRVDSTTGLQMAYVKDWAARSYKPLELRPPTLFPGPGAAIRGDACQTVSQLPQVDLAYLDPPYNQHRYFTNYHIWETLVAWDSPEHYGVACKRIDARDPSTKSVFNTKKTMAAALRQVVVGARAEVVIVSYNNESWVSLPELVEMCDARAEVQVLAFDSARYVGARIGIHNPTGQKVGTISHLRNLEYLVIAGPGDVVRSMAAPYAEATVDERLFKAPVSTISRPFVGEDAATRLNMRLPVPG